MASLLHLTRSRSAYRFEVIVSKVMLILPASLAESKDAVRIHCVLRRNNKVYKTGHLSLTPQDGTLSGDFASTLTFPCTLYWGKDAFDKKAFSVAVLLEDKPLEFTGTIDLAAFASHEKAMSADAEVKLSPAGSISFHLASHLSEDGDEVDGEVEEEIVAIDKTRKELSATRREPSGNKLVPLRLLSPPPVVTSGQGNALFQSFQPIDHKEDQTPLSPGSANPLSPLSPPFGAGRTSPPPVPPSSPFSPSSPLSPDGARSPASPLPFALVKNSQAPVAPLAVYPTEVPFTHTRRHSLSGPVQESPKPADRSLNPQKPPSPTNADKNRLSPSSRPTRLPSASGFVATVPLSQAAASRAFQYPSEAADTPSSGNLSAPQSSSAGTSPRVHSAQELDALNSVSSILMGADPSKR